MTMFFYRYPNKILNFVEDEKSDRVYYRLRKYINIRVEKLFSNEYGVSYFALFNGRAVENA